VWKHDVNVGTYGIYVSFNYIILYKEVVSLFRNTTKQWTLVEIDGENGSETITCTPGHKFFLPENKNRGSLNEIHEHEGYELLSEQWVSAQNLKKGDKVLLENCGEIKITKKIGY
jgi:intein/homing endonuclease